MFINKNRRFKTKIEFAIQDKNIKQKLPAI